ncbi:MAG: VirB4 family type IV secretion system protein [Acutalibacteraceae bacterium]
MPDNYKEELDTYTIPPNFMESGTLFGGAFKLRNALEAGTLVLAIGLPVFRLPISLTMRIILLCLTALPLGLIALIGVSGESLSSFIFSFFRFLKKRRIVSQPAEEDNPTQPNDLKGHRARAARIQTPMDYFPIQKIEHGVIYTRDHRYVKVLEVTPINFLLRRAREQRSILYSYVHYLKISPVKVQMKVLTKKADVNRHLESIRREFQNETDEKCRELQKDYENLIRQIGSKEAITRRFFLIFEYEGFGRHESEEEMLSALMTAEQTAKTYLLQCGNKIVEPESEDEATVELLYELLNRKTSTETSLSTRSNEVIARHLFRDGTDELGDIPAAEFFAPPSMDFRHAHYLHIDGTYYSYLLIPSSGYKPRVAAGWLSILINAGEGIDVDMFLFRQPKEQVIHKLGQQLRINRSKIRDVSDTNTDFDDLEGAIRSGYFLKDGLAANEDFYYFSTLITVTAGSVKELNWRIAELKKLLVSQDLNASPCTFRQEDAFLSSLPLVSLEKHLYARSRRNMLTLGAASCYPFTSYELCDDTGILLGINKHNNSLVIADLFNSQIYKNANMAILGTSGSGKSFTLQLFALRLRRKNIQVFILAPLKGHEFYRAARNIGGEIIQISPSSPHCINVMEIRPVDTAAAELLDEAVIEKSLLTAKIQRLHIFFALLIPDMTHEERQLLDEAMIKTYASFGITHENTSLVDEACPERFRPMPKLGDLHQELLKSPQTRRLANILNRLVHGSASTFNQDTNVNLDNKYTVLDISELTGDLLTVGMFVALDFVWDKAKQDRTKEKAIFIDETWQLIGASSNKLAAEYVLEIFKIVRGYGGSAICATQDLDDFFALEGGKYGRGIVNNAKTKIILNLEDEEAQRVQELLHLSEAETLAITHFERGNGLISTNNNNVTVEFKASELEKELITTDRRELQQLLEKKKRQNAVPSS